MIWTIARKDLKVIFRDKTALIFTFALPFVFVVFFGFIFSGQGGDKGPTTVHALVYNADKGPHGQELIDSMKLVGLQPELETTSENSLEERMKKGEKPLGVIIPADFSAKLDKGAVATIDRTGKPEPAPLRVITDPAEPQVAGMAQGILLGASRRVTGILYGKLVKDRYGSAPSDSSELINLNIQTASQLAGTHVVKRSVGDSMLPGLAVYFVFFMAQGMASTLIVEREAGTLRRMLAAPATRFQILAGKMLARFILGALQSVALFGFGAAFMKLHLAGALLGITVIATATILAAMTLGMWIATMGKTLEQIQGMITLAMLGMGMISGCLVPRQFFPEALQKASYITPHAWALTAYQDILLRDLPLTKTLPNILMTLAFGAVFLFLGLRRFQYDSGK